MPDLAPSQYDTSAGLLSSRDLAAATIAEGDVIVWDVNNQWVLANATTLLLAGQRRIARASAPAAIGFPVKVFEAGPGRVNLGPAVSTAATEIVISVNDGKMAPHSDLIIGNVYTTLGWMETDEVFRWSPQFTGVLVP